MMTRFCSQKNYEQTGTKKTEIHSHHCLYCDATFPQFDDLIKHSRENHPYHLLLLVLQNNLRPILRSNKTLDGKTRLTNVES